MIDSPKLLTDLKKEVTKLHTDLRARCDAEPAVNAPLQSAYDAARAGQRTALTYKAWREEELTNVAVAWVLACVFIRFLEDNGLVETLHLAGADAAGIGRARDQQIVFFREHPGLSEREYLEHVFTETAKLPGMADLFDRRHNPLWTVGPSGDAARAFVEFWRKADAGTGRPVHDFSMRNAECGVRNEEDAAHSAFRNPHSALPDTRFLGDLYQDLSEAARKRYALLQTPVFIEQFILDRTLTPAIETFGFRAVRMIDPTCGSGHFLLGGFARLHRLWFEALAGEAPAVVAQHALDQVFGVDLNPNVVAIARFRLLLAALRVSGVRRLRDAFDFKIHVAAGDALLHGRRFREFEDESARAIASQRTFDTEALFRDELRHHYEVEDTAALHRILGQPYHAVVGNPPYITVKDRALSELYRARYPSCSGKYSLSVPFMERFFDLAVKGDGTPRQPAGFVGQITANSFMKREFGKKLIEEYLPRWDLTHVLDTSGAYIPGHGTPTVILFGKNQPPVSSTIRTVLGIRGEPATPADPAQGFVWQAIVRQIDEPGSVSEWVSAADSLREKFHSHPWSIGGGGTADLKDEIDEAGEKTVFDFVEIQRKKPVIGFGCVLGEDEIFQCPRGALPLRKLPPDLRRPVVEGDLVRDWCLSWEAEVLFPYTAQIELRHDRAILDYFWSMRTLLGARNDFSKATYRECGRPFWEYHQIPTERNQAEFLITFGEITTHNHFALNRGGKVFNRTAPIIKLKASASEEDHVRLLGVLNSSTACFWLRQVCFPKGGDHQGSEGARVRTTLWDERFAFNASQIANLPIPARQPTQLPTLLVQTSTAQQGQTPAATLASWGGPGSGDLRACLARARDAWHRQRRQLIAWQEELDWQIYEAFGLVGEREAAAPLSPTSVSQPEGQAAIPPEGLALGERAFEIVLARRLAAGEVQTTWFARHGSTPITEVPPHWPAAYRELVERRLRRIADDPAIRLIEQPEYKRRWNTEPWDEQFTQAARDWLLARLETYFFESERMTANSGSLSLCAARGEGRGEGFPGPTAASPAAVAQPHLTPALSPPPRGGEGEDLARLRRSFVAGQRPALTTTNQLAEIAKTDAAFQALAEQLMGGPGFSVPKLVRELVESASVPNLPAQRYKPSGLLKREQWESVWDLQRREDAIDAQCQVDEPGLPDAERNRRQAEAAALKKTQVGDIPVPPKYASADFKKTVWWSLRGKLDVPKERWISYPGTERTEDPSPVIAWAGWDPAQQARALAEYTVDAKQTYAFPPEKLTLLLAGLLELQPWLDQWHAELDPAFGVSPTEAIRAFLDAECHALGVTREDLERVRMGA